MYIYAPHPHPHPYPSLTPLSPLTPLTPLTHTPPTTPLPPHAAPVSVAFVPLPEDFAARYMHRRYSAPAWKRALPPASRRLCPAWIQPCGLSSPHIQAHQPTSVTHIHPYTPIHTHIHQYTHLYTAPSGAPLPRLDMARPLTSRRTTLVHPYPPLCAAPAGAAKRTRTAPPAAETSASTCSPRGSRCVRALRSMCGPGPHPYYTNQPFIYRCARALCLSPARTMYRPGPHPQYTDRPFIYSCVRALHCCSPPARIVSHRTRAARRTPSRFRTRSTATRTAKRRTPPPSATATAQVHPALPYLALPCLALPCPAFPCITYIVDAFNGIN